MSTGIRSFEPRELSCFPVLCSLRTAQNRPARAQSRSEPLRACPEPLRAAQSVRSELFREPLWVAQSRSESPGAVAQGRPEPLRIPQSAPRAARSRPERSLRAVRGTALGRPEPLRVAQSGRSASPRAIPSEEPLRIARSVPRAAQSRSELLEKPIGELGVTCTLHIRCSVLLHMVPSSPCMYMHGCALVYIYIYIYAEYI